MERQARGLRTKPHVPAVSLLRREKTNFYFPLAKTWSCGHTSEM